VEKFRRKWKVSIDEGYEIAACFHHLRSKRKDQTGNIKCRERTNVVLFTADKDALNRIWSDDFVFTNPAGKVSRKAARLAGLKPTGDQRIVESNHSDKIEVYPLQ
jgi:hypothetical protein